MATDSPVSAAAVVVQILGAVGQLSDQPMMGKPWKREGTRKLVVTKYPYVIIYRITPRTVYVLAVIHQAKRIA
ncbi:MAG: type II toxin-antitoxin system RelE/ParE family toxin [Sideroxydans sp.]|nr:type II toxin-antitoxin system RelE/ParE family toxin [Sideroxydans sp.]